MPFTLRFRTAARRDLKKLPQNIQEEILLTHIPTIKANPYSVGFPLRGSLRSERSYHFGSNPQYRIIYIIEDEQIIVTTLGTREDIYKRAKRRRRR